MKYARNAKLRSVVRFLVESAPTLIPTAAECLKRNRCGGEYRKTGQLRADDLPGVEASLVHEYNARMAALYHQMPDRHDERARRLRGLAFELLVCEAYRAFHRAPAWQVHRDCQVWVDERLIVMEDRWNTSGRDRAQSCDLAVWPADSATVRAWFVSCKLSAKEFAELDIAYLFEIWGCMKQEPKLGLAASAWPRALVIAIYNKCGSVIDLNGLDRFPKPISPADLVELCLGGGSSSAELASAGSPQLPQ